MPSASTTCQAPRAGFARNGCQAGSPVLGPSATQRARSEQCFFELGGATTPASQKRFPAAHGTCYACDPGSLANRVHFQRVGANSKFVLLDGACARLRNDRSQVWAADWRGSYTLIGGCSARRAWFASEWRFLLCTLMKRRRAGLTLSRSSRMLHGPRPQRHPSQLQRRSPLILTCLRSLACCRYGAEIAVTSMLLCGWALQPDEAEDLEEATELGQAQHHQRPH